MFCIITEWEDGTVAATGPYDTEDAAKADLLGVAKTLSQWEDDPEPDPIMVNEQGTHAIIGEVETDHIEAYVQEMGKPSTDG